MNRGTTLTTMALLCLAVALPAGDAAGQQKSLRDQLVGAWTYVSDEFTIPDGTKRPSPFGANPKGILILDASGRYADIEMRPDRPKFKGSPPYRETASAEVWGEAAKGFAVNFGTWWVDEASKTLIQHWEGSLFPNNEGRESKNSISLTGDELKLVGNVPGGFVDTEVLRRATPTRPNL
jgi:hypothetical protein